ncbi:MAG: hypothetical protein HQ562_11145 [Candidatus Marinimicrobia bacterium]|nr:hypothetical protein [Candidatus Neomarinimicrobiota bacterium]
MKFIIYLSLFCLGSWGLLSGLIPQPVAVEIFWGMLGPWLVGIVTILLAQHIFRQKPQDLTKLMITSFFGKMLFYGVYISLLILFGSIETVPFVISFTVYFIVLHIIEALYFQSIFKPKKMQ